MKIKTLKVTLVTSNLIIFYIINNKGCLKKQPLLKLTIV